MSATPRDRCDRAPLVIDGGPSVIARPARLAEYLAQLPGLAARTAPPAEDRGPTAGGIDPTRIIHPDPGPRLPPGLDLATIDRSIQRQHSTDLLAALTRCVRVVGEECDTETWRTFPERPTDATWRGEVRWLLATMHWWTTDDWCTEWITGEVCRVRAALIERVERASGWSTCALCGQPITTYETDTLAVAECTRCDRVISMRERESLTTSQAAAVLGISEAAVRKQLERGDLRKVGRRGKESLLAPTDGLDWARQKLGLPTAQHIS